MHHAPLHAAILALLPAHAPGARILDTGCGNGALAGELLKLGYRVTGVDASESGIAICRQAYPQAAFHVASITDATLPDGIGSGYDSIIAAEVIEHLYAPAAFLANSRRLLKPGGSLIISTPYHGYVKNLAMALAGVMDRHFQPRVEGGHIKFWSRATLDRALRAAGFTPSAFTGVGRIPGLWKSMVVRAEVGP